MMNPGEGSLGGLIGANSLASSRVPGSLAASRWRGTRPTELTNGGQVEYEILPDRTEVTVTKFGVAKSTEDHPTGKFE
jgi:hypothetical protein